MGVLCDLVLSLLCTFCICSLGFCLWVVFSPSLHGQSFLCALSTLKIFSSLSMNSPAVSCEFSTQL